MKNLPAALHISAEQQSNGSTYDASRKATRVQAEG